MIELKRLFESGVRRDAGNLLPTIRTFQVVGPALLPVERGLFRGGLAMQAAGQEHRR